MTYYMKITMKFYILFLHLSILIPSYVYCVLPPHLFNDHCYEVDSDFSFIQKDITPLPISRICFYKDSMSYEIESYTFVAWHVTVTSMASTMMNFKVWKVQNLNFLVTCKFETVNDALNFHREIYDDRMYDVPNRLEPAEEWKELPNELTENLPIPFKIQRSNDISAVAMVQKCFGEYDNSIIPEIIAKPSQTAELLYENYERIGSEYKKIFMITIGETNARRPVAIIPPNGFELVEKYACGEFLVVMTFNIYYIMALPSKPMMSNLHNTLSSITPLKINSCPLEIARNLDQLNRDLLY